MTDHAETTIQRIIASETFRRAAAVLAAEHERTVGDIIRLTEVEAPSFNETVRAETWFEMAKAHGLSDLEIDAEGNVTGIRRGIGNGPLICVAAHLDTVFPAGTNVKVRREGTKLFAPGVGDDTRSLAVLLAWMRAMDAAGLETRADILFVADVGEEGHGDLRGMRHLFQRGRYKDRISTFITVDSPNMERIVTGGVGSKRYRVTFKGARRT
jgi:tripeptide aminopeptidase